MRDIPPALGAWLGLWVGSLVEERFVGYQPRAYGWMRLVLHSATGLALVLGLRVGLKALLGASEVATLIRYVGIGAGATLIAPWLFTRIRPPLAQSDQKIA